VIVAKKLTAKAHEGLLVEVPAKVREEILAVAHKTHRSVAFIVRRALSAAKDATGVAPPAQDRVSLAVTADEDDPPETLGKLRALVGTRSLDEAVAGAWSATREKFLSFVQRAEAADAAAVADDLDRGLADASHPETSAERLAELAKSAYPKVRALAAAHPTTATDVLTRLARDKDRTVRQAVLDNANTPAQVRSSIKID
jgi:hypothetical protein